MLLSSNAGNGYDNVGLLEIGTKRIEWLTRDKWEINSGRFSPDGKLLASGYAVWDVASDVLVRHSHESDAAALAQLTGVPAIVWGGLWIGLSLAALVYVIKRLA